MGRRSSNSPITSCNTKGKTKSRSEFDIWSQELDTIEPSKSDLGIYLEEGLYICKRNLDVDFDALDWWKANTLKFCILSNMARDLLSISISIVASKSAFSAGGQVLDQYRSSLKSKTVQALICVGDWLCSNFGVNKPLESDEESMKEGCLEQF
ncbi:zinc finger BED domain-containing protein RICESLEEPER 3-like [Camellia sinensis]|uniref:zinc finger BED domain-containing protein RICESLEEPER 3-like n=1 Tax=Camellia sinensis TaxID=4442 RepID=UPI001036EB1E|nr:zinc finger BED domain-containing protein RICESLEEPER 3-like [Camellia sinensis]